MRLPDLNDRLEREVAAAFREVIQARPGDEAKLAAMIGAALASPPGGAPPATGGVAGKLWPKLLGGVGGLVVAALVLLSSRDEDASPEVAAVVAAGPVAAASAAELPGEEEPAEPLDVASSSLAPRVPGPEPGTLEPSTTRRSRRRAAAPAPPPSGPELPDDPDALLRAANQARRARSFAEADRRYTDLQARFPDSRAARTSQVSHGRVLLDTLDRPAGALDCFTAYLAAEPGGTLAEEAMVGRAQALRKMGREADARGAWRSLLERFPDSVHAPTARIRLAEAGP